jgi:type IV pilus assembly protein PilA
MLKQKGFTLIELMIVVAIVGILAAIAIPAYQDFIARSKVSEAAATAGACKTSVGEFIAAKQAFPADAQAAGCATAATQYTASTTVGALGVISVQLQNVTKAVNGKALILTPHSKGDLSAPLATADESIQGWKCTTNATAAEFKFFPATCRQ